MSKYKPGTKGPAVSAGSTVERLQTLVAISNSLEFGSGEGFGAALETATAYLGMEMGLISHISGERYTVAYCYSADDSIDAGTLLPLQETYCSITLEHADLVAIDHMATSEYHGRPCYESQGLETYIGAPLVVHNEPFGTLCFARHSMLDQPWSDIDREFVRLMAHWVGLSLDRLATEEALRTKERQLRLFVEYSPAAVAMFDREVRYIVHSKEWLKAYGLEGQEILGRSHYEVFPEISDAWKAIHQRCLRGGIERRDEDPFPRADGRMDWVQWEIRPWRDAVGQVGGIIMFTQVITERKLSELARAESERRFGTLFQIAPVGIFLTDSRGLCEVVNERWCEITGMNADQAKGLGWSEGLHPEGRDEVFSKWNEAAGRGQAFQAEIRWQRPDGTDVWTRSRAAPLFDDAGQLNGYLGTIDDITETRAYQDILEEMTRTDPLTQLRNRRAFQESLMSECARANRYGTSLCLLVVDIDHFKAVNDAYGHPVGDEVIRATAYVIQASVRASDMAARWGGEEFVVLLPETEVEAARAFAERVRTRISTIGHRDENGDIFTCTASMGIATYRPEMPSEALFAAADEALYVAKSSGRDQVQVAVNKDS